MLARAFAFFVLSGLCLHPLLSTAQLPIDDTKLLDLTYTFDDKTIYWPGNKSFHWEKTDWGMTKGGYWYASAVYGASEHGGTHIDAPIHFGANGDTTEKIPLTKLVGPAVVIDVSRHVQDDPDYRLAIRDITTWEEAYGRIPDGAIVLMYTGWGTYWPDAVRYLGSKTPDDATSLHFPGFSKEAAQFLVSQRAIDGVGIDTASIDYGQSKDFIVHQVLNSAGIYALENVANLDAVPPKGAMLLVMPMKIAGGTGGPARIVALLP